MKGIAIYVEGGGDNVHQKAELRRGLDMLLKSQKDAARTKKMRWKLVPCGSRGAAYDAFMNSLHSDDAFINVLLIDSEEGISARITNDETENARIRVAHLTQRDGWNLAVVDPKQVHLMVQCMEAWIVSDPEALAQFYGQGFLRNALSSRQNLEDEPKPDIYETLARTTRNTQKGEYGKIKHASKLLERIDPSEVVRRCPHFSIFIQWLDHEIADDPRNG
ncbi:MAG: DUF4276 family protein [Nitrospiraceae bacterium]|nr:DUF4276 family protein [Nitrospiraceae bacterium]